MKDSCSWKDGTVIFTWSAAPGAKEYQLILKDGLQKKKLVEKRIPAGPENQKDCNATLEKTEKLRPGETCMAKILTHAQNGSVAETDWKTYLIGMHFFHTSSTLLFSV